MNKLIVILTLLLSACASVTKPREKPLIYEEQIAGNHAVLARCVVNRLQKDSNWSIRMLRFSNWLYPDVDASEIFAHDMRFLPGVYARNSPTNPDAVFDYVSSNPEIRSFDQRSAQTELPYAFALMIKKIDDNRVVATLRGSKYAGGIARKHLHACAASKRGMNQSSQHLLNA